QILPMVVERDAPVLWSALDDPNATLKYFSWPRFESSSEFVALLGKKNSDGHLSTAVLKVDGVPLGMASYMRRDPANGSVEIGAIVHGPGLARTAGATEAHYLLARHVFETLGYRRYEWKCDARNLASIRAAKRFGFTYEGTFRQHAVVKGENRDTAWFSIIDRDWPRLAQGFRAWLDSSNFDQNGNQRQRLEECRTS
ncbi:MAG: GNAT family protein, partial [Myxococcota bacterium]